MLSDAVDSCFISDFFKQFVDALLRMMGDTWVAAESLPARFTLLSWWPDSTKLAY